MATVHETFVGIAQMDSVLALADFIRDDEARIAPRLQIPGVIEGRRRAGRIAIPADARKGHKLVDLALQRQAEGRPVKDRASNWFARTNVCSPPRPFQSSRSAFGPARSFPIACTNVRNCAGIVQVFGRRDGGLSTR